MPRCCVVNGCPSKTTIFHGFPQDEKRREGWIEFVRRSGRPDWVPKKNSVICSLHFELDCYSYHPGRDPGFLQLFGLSQRQPRLTRGAQPTIEPGTAAFVSALTVDQRCRLAGSGPESDVVRDSAAIYGVNTEPASAGSPCVPAPGSTASSVSEEPAPFVPRSTRDVQTQCHVQVAMKCDQVDIKLRKVSKCMQTGDITTDQDVASAYRRRVLWHGRQHAAGRWQAGERNTRALVLQRVHVRGGRVHARLRGRLPQKLHGTSREGSPRGAVPHTVSAAKGGCKKDKPRLGPPFVVHLTVEPAPPPPVVIHLTAAPNTRPVRQRKRP
ncbi:uncharacterized protein LOC144149653 isoform X2 [Haemaphysalis longicornis]